MKLVSVERRPESPGVEAVQLVTDLGVVDTRLHAVEQADMAVIWVGGAGGGLTGPAGGLYPRLAERLIPKGIASLRVDYRRPNELIACVLDVMICAAFLESEGYQQLVLVGHSFGGAVVITAGARLARVVGVVALSSQNAGTEAAPDLSPRPLLLIHGTGDRVLPFACSVDIEYRARQPKDLVLLPGCGHGLDECRADLDRAVEDWISALNTRPAE